VARRLVSLGAPVAIRLLLPGALIVIYRRAGLKATVYEPVRDLRKGGNVSGVRVRSY